MFAPISSVTTPHAGTDIDKGYASAERWQEHIDHGTSQPATGGHGMADKIQIRPLDKKETTGDSGGNGGS
ncbi:hypothetical protein [Streptomyces arenae]|uniref:hypothetical protein n=1 Tax=Streptomyces arenae TaxID=29301 RepID=UPI0026590D5C|nr:hypothetical protein [Streptomyces arenae]MCG7206917.1 hypothetical protein [Streptomyces arenae]